MPEYPIQAVDDFMATTAMSFGEMRIDMLRDGTKLIDDFAAIISERGEA